MATRVRARSNAQLNPAHSQPPISAEPERGANLRLSPWQGFEFERCATEITMASITGPLICTRPSNVGLNQQQVPVPKEILRDRHVRHRSERKGPQLRFERGRSSCGGSGIDSMPGG
jgi:hypothetical protein